MTDDPCGDAISSSTTTPTTSLSCGADETVCPGRDGCYPDALQIYNKLSFSFSSLFDDGDRDNPELLEDVPGWISGAVNDENPGLGEWLLIDAGVVRTVAGVATQGRGDGSNDQWVSSFKVSVSVDNTTWTAVDGGATLGCFLSPGCGATFVGNTDTDTVVKNKFSGVVHARYVRIEVVTWEQHIAMRAALLLGPSVGQCVFQLATTTTTPLPVRV